MTGLPVPRPLHRGVRAAGAVGVHHRDLDVTVAEGEILLDRTTAEGATGR